MSKAADPFQSEALARQVRLQRQHAWDGDKDISWEQGIDTSRHFLPLDDMAIAFPGASREQALALSQWMGLVVNATVSEMEDALPSLKAAGWQRILNQYPVGPEMWELGELFFDEEAKHARAFSRYLDLFCETTGVERTDLDSLMPKAFGSQFQKTILANAEAGGHAFWWVVETVEEISIEIFRDIDRNREFIDPLYYELHKRHLEEESRHANYAVLMLRLARQTSHGARGLWHRKSGFVISQMAAVPWVLGELAKIFRVAKFKGQHPFFDVLASCLPLFQNMSKRELARRMFYTTPYVSWMLNPAFKRKPPKLGRDMGAWIPKVRPPERFPLKIDAA